MGQVTTFQERRLHRLYKEIGILLATGRTLTTWLGFMSKIQILWAGSLQVSKPQFQEGNGALREVRRRGNKRPTVGMQCKYDGSGWGPLGKGSGDTEKELLRIL